MTIYALAIGGFLSIAFILVGIARNKTFVVAIGAAIATLLIGYVMLLVLVNSRFWPM